MLRRPVYEEMFKKMNQNGKNLFQKINLSITACLTRIRMQIYVQYSELKLSESHDHPKYSQEKAIG